MTGSLAWGEYLPGFSEGPEAVSTRDSKLGNRPDLAVGDRYPDLETDGFIELKYSGRDHDTDLDKLDKVRSDPTYQKLPLDVLNGDPRMDIRYRIRAKGKLDEDLSVSYEVEKEPDLPGQFNILVEKDTTELQFGHFEENYSYGEFINVNKSLNGLRVSTEQDNWDGGLAMGKTKSEPQKYESFGTGETIYKLGKSFVLEGSERVFVNNQALSAGADYTIDYYDGKITFTSPKTKADFIKVIYEFTNPIADFIPSLSRKSFVGGNYLWRPASDQVRQVKRRSDVTEILFDGVVSGDAELALAYTLNSSPVVLGSETIRLNGVALKPVRDYFLKHRTGRLVLRNLTLREGDKLSANYEYFLTQFYDESFQSNGSPGPYILKGQHLIVQDTNVFLDGVMAREFVDYVMDYESGRLFFNYPLSRYQRIRVSYRGVLMQQVAQNISKSPLSVGVSYLQESSSLREDLVKGVSDELAIPVPEDVNSVQVANNPLDASVDPIVKLNGTVVTDNIVSIDAYRGRITFNEDVSGETVKVSYSYLDSNTTEFTIGVTPELSGLSFYESPTHFLPPNLPVKFGGVDRIVLYRGRDAIELDGTGDDADFSVDYLDDGDRIRINFLVGANSINFQSNGDLPQLGDSLRVFYQNSSGSAVNQGSTDHQMVGVNVRYEASDRLTLESEVANSSFSFSKTRLDASEVLSVESVNVDQKFSLSKNGNSPLVEDSEQVFLNGQSLTRGVDYFINYDLGTIQFINQVIPVGSEIQVTYEFFSSAAPEKDSVNAYRFAADFAANEKLKLRGAFSSIDPNFRSIGELEDSRGTNKVSTGLEYKFNSQEHITLDFDSKTRKNVSDLTILNEDELVGELEKVFGAFDTSHEFRYFERDVTQNAGQNDIRILSYSPAVTFGPRYFRTRFSGSYSDREDFFNDANRLRKTEIVGWGIDSTYKPYQPWLLRSASYNPYFFQSEDSIRSQNPSENALFKQTRFYGIRFKSQVVKHFDTTLNFEKKDILNRTPSRNVLDEFYNLSSFASYDPYYWLDTSVQFDHSESVGPVIGQEDKVSRYFAYRIDELQPYSGLQHLGVSERLAKPFLGSKFSYSHDLSRTREAAGLERFSQDADVYGLTAFEPVQGFRVSEFRYTVRGSNTQDDQQNSTQQSFRSANDYERLDGKVEVFRPNGRFKPFKYSGTFSDSKSNTDSNLLLKNGTQNLSDRVFEEGDFVHTFSFDPGSQRLGNLKLGDVRARYIFSLKDRQDLTNTISIPQTASSISVDNQRVNSDFYEFGFSPFGVFDVDTSALDQSETINRNRFFSSSQEGLSLYKTLEDLQLKVGASPWSFLDLDGYVRDKGLFQVSAATINRSVEFLQTGDELNRKLVIDQELFGLKATATPASWYSVAAAWDTHLINQSQKNENGVSGVELEENKYTGTLTYLPFEGLSLAYSSSVKVLEQSGKSFDGNSDEWVISYQPINYKNFKLNLQYKRAHNGGFGFNDLAQDVSLLESGQSVGFLIAERDDTVSQGSIIMSLDMLLDNVQYLEKLILTGEGYTKVVEDKKNSGNDYSLTGFLFKLTLLL